MNNNKYKSDFPLLNNKNIVYLDTAATSQKPQCVIDAISEFYTEYNANPLRGLYELSSNATDIYEEARERCASFINASSSREIIFTRNATESLNLSANILSTDIKEGDEILVATSEHHSNFLPWKKLAEERNASVAYLDCNEEGEITPDALKNALTDKTRILCIAWISNVIGRVNPIKEYVSIAHERNVLTVIDATQGVAHLLTDVRDTDADFLAFSSHKMYGPMGIGVLYVKENLLSNRPSFLEGGEMVDYVSKEKTVYSDIPHKYEAGTVSAADAYGFKKAIEYIENIGFEEIGKVEDELTKYAMDKLLSIEYVRIVGSKDASKHKGIISFNVDGVHPHDVAEILSQSGICVRAGDHCAKPLHIHLGIHASVRLSIGIYNTEEDIDRLIEVLSTVREKSILIKHNLHPAHCYSLPGAAYVRESFNPSCSDEIKLFVDIENGYIKNGSFEGSMCSVSKGTADMMLDLIIGKKVSEVGCLRDIVFKMFDNNASNDEIKKLEETGSLRALQSSKARAGCVLFVWRALGEILNQAKTKPEKTEENKRVK